MSEILRCENVCFAYDKEQILNNVNMSIEQGSFTAILGRNGAGKSTLFLNINGVHKKDSGKIYYNNEEIIYNKKGIENIRKKIGIVFQNPDYQLFSASVLKDVSFGAVNLGFSYEEARQKSIKALEEVDMVDFIDKPTHALSFGQKKRVAIAGILVMEPEIIILDEISAGLDPMGAYEILTLLKNINKEKNTTIILATHDMDILPLYCDYAYVLDKGSVVLHGKSDEILMQSAEVMAEKAVSVGADARRKQARTAAGYRYISEEETRYMIDEQLRKVGWEADSQELRYAKGTRPKKEHNMVIAEWPVQLPGGRTGHADYAVFIGLKMVAIIEAKAMHKDIPSVLDYQGKAYPKGIREADAVYQACIQVNFDFEQVDYVNCSGHREGNCIVLDSILYPYEFAGMELKERVEGDGCGRTRRF